MAVEMGAFTGLVRPDRRVAEYLRARRGVAPEALERSLDEIQADPGACYKHTIAIDVDGLAPMVALPGDPGHGVPVADITEGVKIDIAFGGSCTASKQEDMDMYAEVFAHGLARGKRIPDHVRCWLQFGSVAVREYCRERGHIEVFEQAGVRVLEPGCGACCNAGPGVSFSKEEVTVSSINRNYPGRSGPGSVYLASPYTVAASALAGMLVAYDPT
jgi:3-isopropylmalate/(R)-2-methylmalate dehydratase large subunit